MNTKNGEYSTTIYKWWSDRVMCTGVEMFYDFMNNELLEDSDALEYDVSGEKDKMIIRIKDGEFLLEEYIRDGFYNEMLISRFFDYDNRKKKGTLFELK